MVDKQFNISYTKDMTIQVRQIIIKKYDLKKLRKKAGISMRSLEKLSGVNKSIISKAENGYLIMSENCWNKIKEVLDKKHNMDMSYTIGDSEEAFEAQVYNNNCVFKKTEKLNYMQKPEITKKCALDMQVCVPKEWNDKQVLSFAEKENPCGTANGWQIRRQGAKDLRGDDERVPCSDKEDYVHIMLDA